MARNEEKQLARLNRFYLEKERQENLKKRPPRPRLDSLTTSREIRKWIPSITQDIDFYVKKTLKMYLSQQMEVPCYPERKLEEFSDRIRQLKQEYTAFLRKLRMLEPETNTVSWSNRPYSSRKRCKNESLMDSKDGSEESEKKQTLESYNVSNFAPIATPVLQKTNALKTVYGFQKQTPILWNANPETEDQPLQFMTSPNRPAVMANSQQMEQYGCGDNEFNASDQMLPSTFRTSGQGNSTSEASEISAAPACCKDSGRDIVPRSCSDGPNRNKCDVKWEENAGSTTHIIEKNECDQECADRNHEENLIPVVQEDAVDNSSDVAHPAKTTSLNLDYSDTSSSSDEL